jgi:hypothetical protein
MSCAARSGAITDAWFQPFPGHVWTNQRRCSPSCTVVSTGQAAGGFWLAGTHTPPLPAVDRPIPGHEPAGRSDWQRQRLLLQAVVSPTRWQREATSPRNGLVQSMLFHTVRRALKLRRACFKHGEQHEHQQALEGGPPTKECRPRAPPVRMESASNTSSSHNFPFFFSWVFFSLFPWCESLISSTSIIDSFLSISFFHFSFSLASNSRGQYKHFIFFPGLSDTNNNNPIELGLVYQLTCPESSHPVCDPAAHHSFPHFLSATSNCSVSETTVPPSNRHQETPLARNHHLTTVQHGVSST